MSVLKKFAGQTAIYGLSNILSRMLNFVLTPLYTGVYSTGVYGVFTIMYSYASILNAILAYGMETTYFRYLHKEKDKELVYSNSFFGVASVAVLFLILGLSSVGHIANWLQEVNTSINYAPFVRYFIWILAIDAICVIPFAKLRADERPLRYGVIKIVNISIFIALNLLFLLIIPAIIKHKWPMHEFLERHYQSNWIGYVFISNLIANTITLILLLPEIMKVKFRFSMDMFGTMLSYSWPILIANISFIINENLDKILLNNYLPANIRISEVGIYGACCKLAIFMNIFIQAFRLGAEPFFFSHSTNANAPKTYATIMNYFVIMVCVIFVGLMANLEILKYFLGLKHGKAFWVGLPVVPILLLAYVCLGIYMNLSVWYKLSDQTRYGFYISAVGAILTIILNIIFIPKFSYMASAWTTFIAYFTMMALSYILGQKNYPIPYKLKDALLYIGSSVLLVVLSYKVFNNNIWTGNLLFLSFIVFVFFREKDNIRRLIRA
ncbi:lipopolysaccharide biosynthesis protein [Solitalea koreensis]|uniref:Membrane protein involved in the export of O-antigen and teichoic acid n=1 Tax=Solitalea koreensis TaxID=543615 RepID=A0A521CRC9_9SPHI|nr:polysaccharide biosynthesis C-terminal domain-containing protein [Solitalea koreensis]SMO62017.1 Membrane protein involved in the export of O-antigen and teichoic acid [Solitalea koreensis]